MASIDGLPLNVQNSRLNGGAAFRLSKPSEFNLNWQTPSGSVCQINKNRQWMTVESEVIYPGVDVLLQNTFEDAQKFLDIIAIQTRTFYTLPSAPYNHILWMRENGKTRLRLAFAVNLNVNVKTSFTVKNANGEIQPTPVKKPATWNECLRYFRYANIRDDVYVSYRDAYLTLESYMSQNFPFAKKTDQTEFNWLIRGCTELEKLKMNFDKYIPIPSSNSVEKFVEYIYTANRTAVFHAKHERDHFVPGNLEDRKMVTAALRYLNKFLLDLLTKNFAPGHTLSFATSALFKRVMQIYQNDLVLAVSADSTPVQMSDCLISPQGMPVTSLLTSYMGAVDDTGVEHVFLGRIAVGEMENQMVYTLGAHESARLNAFKENSANWPKLDERSDVILKGSVDGLELSDVDDFEVYLQWLFGQRADLQRDFSL